jgi:hypothetical protein
MSVPSVITTQRSPGSTDMVERTGKAAGSDWRPWALGAALLSMGCAAVLLVLRQRARTEAYETWWERREQLRANGDRPAGAGGHRAHNLQLFI